jgi:hypothetical protein
MPFFVLGTMDQAGPGAGGISWKTGAGDAEAAASLPTSSSVTPLRYRIAAGLGQMGAISTARAASTKPAPAPLEIMKERGKDLPTAENVDPF